MEALIEEYSQGPTYKIQLANKLKQIIKDKAINQEALYKEIKEIEKKCYEATRERLIWQSFNKQTNDLLDKINSKEKLIKKYYYPSQEINVKLTWISCLQINTFRELLNQYYTGYYAYFVDHISFCDDEIILKYYDVDDDNFQYIEDEMYFKNDNFFFDEKILEYRIEEKCEFLDEEAENLLNKYILKFTKYYQPIQIQTDVEQFLQTQFQNSDPLIVRFVCRCSVMTNKDIQEDYLQNENFPIEYLDLCNQIADYFHSNRNKRKTSEKFDILKIIKLPKDTTIREKRIQYYKSGKSDYQGRKNTMCCEEIIENWLIKFAENRRQSFLKRQDISYKNEQKFGYLPIELTKEEIKKYVMPFIDKELQNKILRVVAYKTIKGKHYVVAKIPFIFTLDEVPQGTFDNVHYDELRERYRYVYLYSNKYVFTQIRNRYIKENCQENMLQRISTNFNINDFTKLHIITKEEVGMIKDYFEDDYNDVSYYEGQTIDLEQKIQEEEDKMCYHIYNANNQFESDYTWEKFTEGFTNDTKYQKYIWNKEINAMRIDLDHEDMREVEQKVKKGYIYFGNGEIETDEQYEQRFDQICKSKNFLDWRIIQAINPDYTIQQLLKIHEILEQQYNNKNSDRRRQRLEKIEGVMRRGDYVCNIKTEKSKGDPRIGEHVRIYVTTIV